MNFTRAGVCLVALTALLSGGVAAAQAPAEPPAASSSPFDRKWELEAHGGWADYRDQTAGSGSLPTSGSVVGGQISLSTFFFGAGTRLFNGNAADVSRGQPVKTISALDPILTGAAIRWQRPAGTLGVRIGRSIGHRYAVEFTADRTRGVLAFTDAALKTIEAGRASFAPALEQALGTSVPSSVTAEATITDRQRASQMFASGTVMVNLRETGRVIPYLAAGGGVVFNRVDATPTAVIVGHYRVGAPAQIFGTDAVRLSYSVEDRTYVGLGGAGLRFFTTPRWGVRLDGRLQLVRNTTVNLVDAAPADAQSSAGAPFPLVNSGALQFSSTAPMTGATISGAPTFKGSGVQAQVSLVVGLFWRF